MRALAIARHTRTLYRCGGLRNTLSLLTSLSSHLICLKTRSNRPIVAISLLERMGDCVAVEPIIRQVSQKHANAQIFFVTSHRFRELFENHPILSGVIGVRNLTEWRVLAKLAPFDQIYDLHPNNFPCHHFQPILKRHGGDSPVTMENYYNFGNLLCAFSTAAGLPYQDETPVLTIPRRIVKKIDALCLPKQFVVLHTSSEDVRRDWQPHHWQRLKDSHLIPLVELGNRRILSECFQLPRTLSILETAEIIRRGQLFIGVDSGPAHLANAVGTPGIILLGSFLNFNSYTPHSGFFASGGAQYVRSQGPVANLSFEAVQAEVAKVLSAVTHVT